MSDLTSGEGAAVDQVLAALVDYAVARLRLDLAAMEATAAFEAFALAWQVGDDLLTLDEAEQVAQHPDLAELNVSLDGWYGA